MSCRAFQSELTSRVITTCAVISGHRSRLILVPLAISMLACGPTETPPSVAQPPVRNAILITIDTLRADHVGAYGTGATTPTLDRLAADGIVFERCVSQTPLTLPSHTTILSGTYPLHHRVRDNGGYVVPQELELISEVLKEDGYATAAFVGAYVLHSKWGLNQGFDHYGDRFDQRDFEQLRLQNALRADQVIEQAEEWIADNVDRRFFTWIHLFDPHAPYQPPPPFDSDTSNPYRGEVEYTDHVLGRFVDFLEGNDLLSNTLLVVTSDHGEGLGEHGEKEHGLFLYDTTIKVPLIVRTPFAPALHRWQELTELVDLTPTILDALDVSVPATVQGSSLWPIVEGRSPNIRTAAYAESFYPRLHYGWSELRAYVTDDRKLIVAPRPELFDLRTDQGELQDLAGKPAYATEVEQLSESLNQLVKSLSGDALDPARATVDRHERAALEALGYLTGSPEIDPDTPLADPKDKIELFNQITSAAASIGEGRYDEAINFAVEAVTKEPSLVDAQILLGNAYRGAGDLELAIERYREVLVLRPDANFVRVDLMACLIDTGAYGEAIELGRSSLEAFPGDPILNEQLSAAYGFLHDHENALRHLEVVLADQPDNGDNFARAAELALLLGRPAEARQLLGQAIEVDPRSRGAWYLRGRMAATDGRSEEALACFQQEVANHPRAYRAAFDAAVILAEQGQREEALRMCRMAIAADPPFGPPYYLLAADNLARNSDLEEAIDLCRTGIAASPEDQNTLIGYQVLLRLLEKTGSHEEYQRAAQAADAVESRLNRQASGEASADVNRH